MFFIDNNLSRYLADGMRGFKEDVTHLLDHFAQNVQDVTWLQAIAQNDWLLITRDERIRKNPAELNALKSYQIGAFFLGGKNRSRCDLIQQLVRNWPRIKRLAARTKRPFAFRIPPRGTKIERLPL